MQGSKHERGSMYCWRTGVGVGVKLFRRTIEGRGLHQIIGVKGGVALLCGHLE